MRKFTWQGDLEHLENGAGALETRVQVGKFTTEFNNSDTINVEATRDYEMIAQPFPVATGVSDRRRAATPSTTCRSATRFGAQRRVAGTVGAAGRRLLERHHPQPELHRRTRSPC